MFDEGQVKQALRRFFLAYAKPYKLSAHNPSVFLETGEQLECYLFGSTTGERNDVVLFVHLENARPLIFGFGGTKWDWRFALLEGSSFFALELVSFQHNTLVLRKIRELNVLPVN